MKTNAEYVIKQDHLFEECVIAFPVPYHDLSKFLESEAWKNLCKHLEEVQTPDMQMFLPDQPIVVEKVLYKNPVTELVDVVRERMTNRFAFLFGKDK